MSKLAFAEVNKRIYSEAINLLGPDGVLIDHYDFIRPESANLTGGLDIRKMFLRARANSIEGGTSEILRNILGERILGLPASPGPTRRCPGRTSRADAHALTPHDRRRPRATGSAGAPPATRRPRDPTPRGPASP